MANKTEIIPVRVTPEQKASLANYAHKLGISLSALFLFAISEKFGETLVDSFQKK